MTITNIQTSSAYPGEGVKVTLDKTNAADMEFLSWAYPGMELTSDVSGDKGIIDTVDRQGNSFIVVPVQPNFTFMGSEPFKLKPTDTISANENKIGNRIWKLVDESTTTFKDGGTIPLITNQTQWGNNTTGAYTHYQNNTSNPKIYNRLAVLRGLSTAINGWRIPNLTDVMDFAEASGSPFVTYTSGTSRLPWSIKPFAAVSLGGANLNGFNAILTGARSGTAGFTLDYPIWHVMPNIDSLPSWLNTSPYTNLRLNFYFSYRFDLNATGYFYSSLYTTGYGVRLCRDIQENVVITK